MWVIIIYLLLFVLNVRNSDERQDEKVYISRDGGTGQAVTQPKFGPTSLLTVSTWLDVAGSDY